MADQEKAISRSGFIKGTAVAGALLGAGAAAAQGAGEEQGLKSEFLCSVIADLEPPQAIGATPQGNRQIFYVTGGSIKGPKINGKVLPGGGDWFLSRPDGVSQLDVKVTVQLDDGTLVYMHYPGLLHTKTKDGSLYFRTTPRFETASEKHDWLNNIIAVGVGQVGQNQVSYDVYAIL